MDNRNNLQNNGFIDNGNRDLSDEYLDEQELRLLQQQQYIQLQQLEQQELELLERQLLQQQHIQQQQRMRLGQHHQNQQQQQQQQQLNTNVNMMTLPQQQSNIPYGQNMSTANQQQLQFRNSLIQQQQQQQRQQQQENQFYNPPNSLDHSGNILLNHELFQHHLNPNLVDAESLFVAGPAIMSSAIHQQQQQQQRQHQQPILSSSGMLVSMGQTQQSLMMPGGTSSVNFHSITPSPLLAMAGGNSQISNQTQNMTTVPAVNTENEIQLADDYEPTDKDICSGRGKAFWNHNGNVAFRNLIQSQVDIYINAPTKAEKSAIVVAIVEDLRRKGCRFLKQQKIDTGKTVWFDIGDSQARDKVGHSLRDQVTALNRSSHSSGNRDGDNSSNNYSRSPILSTSTVTEPNFTGLQEAMGIPCAQNIPIFGGSRDGPDINNNNNNATAVHLTTYADNNNNHNQDRIMQRQSASGVDHQGNNNNNNNNIEVYPHYPRRPSISISDSGNEAEMRRSALDTSHLLMDFGRRPSWVADSVNEFEVDNMMMMHQSQKSLPERQSTSQQRSAKLEEMPEHIETSRVNKSTRSQASSWNISMEDMQGSFSDPRSAHLKQTEYRNSGGRRHTSPRPTPGSGGTGTSSSWNATDSSDLLLKGSIQTIDSRGGSNHNRANGNINAPPPMRISGMSTVRMQSGSMRMSAMRMSEFSLLSANLENMSLIDQSSSSLQYQSMDDSKFEI